MWSKTCPLPGRVSVVRRKMKGSFYAGVPEKQIILAKMSHYDKVEPDARLLNFMSVGVFVYSGEKTKQDILHKKWLS